MEITIVEDNKNIIMTLSNYGCELGQVVMVDNEDNKIVEDRDGNNDIYIKKFFIHDGYRGKGHGKYLFSKCLEYIKHKNKLATLQAMVCDFDPVSNERIGDVLNNKDLVRFYESFGFRFVPLYMHEISMVNTFGKEFMIVCDNLDTDCEEIHLPNDGYDVYGWNELSR